MARELLELSLLDILPSSIADDPNVRAIAQAIDPEMRSVSQDIRETLILSRIDELSEPVVDLLAWQWHVDFYELARTLKMKRAMVKGSIPWHRKKGTRWAILKALEMIGVKGTFIPWWEVPGAKPYTFAIEAEITSGFWSQLPNVEDVTGVIRRAIIESKATRSWLIDLKTIIKAEEKLELYHGTATFRSGLHEIRPEYPELNGTYLTVGIATARGGRAHVGVSRPSGTRTAAFSGIATVQTHYVIIGPAGARQEE